MEVDGTATLTWGLTGTNVNSFELSHTTLTVTVLAAAEPVLDYVLPLAAVPEEERTAGSTPLVL